MYSRLAARGTPYLLGRAREKRRSPMCAVSTVHRETSPISVVVDRRVNLDDHATVNSRRLFYSYMGDTFAYGDIYANEFLITFDLVDRFYIFSLRDAVDFERFQNFYLSREKYMSVLGKLNSKSKCLADLLE